MFAHRHFASRYFAPRYFPPGGSFYQLTRLIVSRAYVVPAIVGDMSAGPAIAASKPRITPAISVDKMKVKRR